MSSTPTACFKWSYLAPAAILALVLLAGACALPMPRLFPATAAAGAPRIMAWLMLALLTGTPICIGWGCAGMGGVRRWVGIGLLVTGLGFLLAGVSWVTVMPNPAGGQARITPLAALQIWLVISTWLAFWMVVAERLARIAGPGLSVAISMCIAMLLLAAPVTFMPLFSAVDGPWRGSAISMVANVCPTLAVLDATGQDFGWMQERIMYSLTALGQDLPLSYPHWWATTLIFSLPALVLAVIPRPSQSSNAA